TAAESINLHRIALVEASINDTPARCPGWRRRRRSAWRRRGRSAWRGRGRASADRSVNAINLIGNTRIDIATGRVRSTAPTQADTKAPARVLPGSAVVGLHSAVSPTPLTFCTKGRVALDLDPICPRTQNCRRAQVNREGGAALHKGLISGAVNLRARKTTT